MKAITIWQPWATLIAIGAKRIETRPWCTRHRGRFAIHAASREPDWVRELVRHEPFRSALAGFRFDELPRGAVIATVELVDCQSVDSLLFEPPAEPEHSFGDYSSGRYAWLLEKPKQRARAVPARGRQMLWDWDESSTLS